MSTSAQPPTQPPAPAAPRSHPTTRRVGVTVLGGATAVGALSATGAPWWAVTVTVAFAITVPGTILLAQVLLPDASEHKRDLWLAWLRNRHLG
ncbi:hypothetical protein ACFWMT_23095 [Streptomyces sp. NPDC058368]|uniref:hypothetical protein n=1 Tax=Streptomyces sp. NPDC058368 TaxID=3346461 RepID=UPI00365664B8